MGTHSNSTPLSATPPLYNTYMTGNRNGELFDMYIHSCRHKADYVHVLYTKILRHYFGGLAGFL